MNRRRVRVTVAAALTALLAGLLTPAVTSAAHASPVPSTTRPTAGATKSPPAADQRPHLTVPVNVVLVGFDKNEVGPGLLAQLAPSGEPVARRPGILYGIHQAVGIHYDYDYQLLEASQQVTDQFFDHQLTTGVDGPATTYQAAYNAQEHNRLDVTGPVLSNDAHATQTWLDQNVALPLGIDVQRSYTVYLVNWWGRPDFRFHNYRVASAVDHDTNIDWANDHVVFPYIPTTHWDQSALSGWGGDTTRSWFYDLSAGPDFYSQNWDVDHADLDGDTSADYRIPPVWEYAVDGFRPRPQLAADLGRVVRYVAVNELFTTSPIYDPMHYQPKPRGALHLHTTTFEHNPAIDADALTDTPHSTTALRTLEPWLSYVSSSKDVATTPHDILRALGGLVFGTPQPPGCWHHYPFWNGAAQLYCTLLAQQATYLPPAGRDTVLPSFTFTGTQDEFATAPFQGYAGDNFLNGTPAFTYQLLWPDALGYGLGNTHVTAHEAGHELGASHPHDGYDPTGGFDYSPGGGIFFAWIGDQEDSLMSYTELSEQFSVFDQDNIARDVYAGYLANMEAPAARAPLQQQLVAAAEQAFNDWRFQDAAGLARQAWTLGAAKLAVVAAHEAALAAAGARPGPLPREPQRVDLGQIGTGSGAARPSPKPSVRPLGRG